MSGDQSSPPRRRSPRRAAFRRRLSAGIASTAAAALAATGVAVAAGSHANGQWRHRGHRPGHVHRQPVAVTVFSPGNGDLSGANGVGFIVDVALDASSTRYNSLLSPQAGYKPYFNDPSSPTFHPGPDPGAPGLVVLLSSTPDKPGTPFQGPDTNLAGLFQINGVARVDGGRAEVWDTWQPGKPLFGTGPTTLTVYVVRGTAPAVVSAHQAGRISNVVHVHFRIAG